MHDFNLVSEDEALSRLIGNVGSKDITTTTLNNYHRQFELFRKRYGGHWRHPEIKDFCFLVNPYYPPQEMIDEMKINTEELIATYPSGMNVNSLLASEMFKVNPRYIVVGNGAAELIKALMEMMSSDIGLIWPTFEEYPNRLPKDRRVIFHPDNDEFRYTASDVINFFDSRGIEALVLVNPDNPSGNYIVKDDFVKLLDWSSEANIKLIVDESFVAFSDEYPHTLIENQTIEKYKNLIVINSISKSYGVPGLRLGVLAACDEELIDKMRKGVSIWNINSFAEYYMQIEGKYRTEYEHSLGILREARRKFLTDLGTIKKIRTIPSQANYIMAEILGGFTADDLSSTLYGKYNTYIKDLSSKTNYTGKQYVRLTVRTSEDNEYLLKSLREVLGE